MSAVPAFKLVEAGFSQPQVEALAEFMQTEAARRSDLLEVKSDLKAEIAEVKADLKAGLARVDGRIVLLQWMIGFVLAFLVAIFAKLFLAH